MALHFDSLLTLITDVGDSACLFAIAAAGSVYLFSRRAHRAAFFLISTYVVAALTIGLLKIVFIGCQSYFHWADVHSPSGHAALSASVLWGYCLLMCRQLSENRRFIPFFLLTLLIAAISFSRVWLHAHTPMEVAIGLAGGIIGLIISYILMLMGRPAASYDAYALALCGVLAGLVAHGMHSPAEGLIHTLASHIKNHIPFCG